MKEHLAHIYGPRVLVQRDEPETKTEGGIHLPGMAMDPEKIQTGTVMYAGRELSIETIDAKGKKNKPCRVSRPSAYQEGERVYFSVLETLPQTVPGWKCQLLLIEDEGILGVLQPDNEPARIEGGSEGASACPTPAST